MNGTIESAVVVLRFNINTISPGNIAINVNGVKALWASLNVLHLLAIAIAKPLINNEYVIITNKANIVVGIDNVKDVPLYISNELLAIFKEIEVNIKEIYRTITINK